jgi:uncharacterized membrane protein
MVNYLPVMLSIRHINEMMHETLAGLVNLFVIVLEFMGLIVIAYTGRKAFIEWIKHDRQTRLHLAEGLAMALEFKLGGEILRTVVVRDMAEIMQVGAIILLRAALTFLIHWEIKNEAAEIEKEHSKSKIATKSEKQP